MKNKKFIAIILIPALIHLLIFIVVPIVGGFVISFLDYNPLKSTSSFVGISNFARMFKDPDFYIALRNTAVFVFVTVTLNIVLSLGIAQLISYFKSNRTRGFFRMIFFMPAVAPMVATSVVFSKSIFPTANGLLNVFLRSIGIASTVNWLGDPKILMLSVIAFTLWVDIGYNIVLFSAGIDGIPSYVYEAAELDGASEWSKFKNITVPLLGRTFFFVTIMTFISHFQMFAQFSVMITKDGAQNSGLVMTRYIYKMAFEYKEMGYASAIAMVLFVIIFIFTLIQRRMNKVDWEY